jgi:hypothetical protein
VYANDSYAFSNVPAGRYYTIAFVDQNENGIQDYDEMAGAFGGAATPQIINATSGAYNANIAMGVPTEVEPNNDFATNNLLLLGTFMHGEVVTTNHDYYKLLIPRARTYTIETLNCSGRVDTMIALYNALGNQLTQDDDSGVGLCSRISYSFPQAGTYYLRVFGYGNASGRYTVGIR